MSRMNSISYTKVLTAEQQAKAKHFMRCLLTNDRKAKQAGLTVDINKFLNSYACEYGHGGNLAEHFKLSDYRKRQIIALRDRGDSSYTIASNIGLTNDKVCRFLNTVCAL